MAEFFTAFWIDFPQPGSGTFLDKNSYGEDYENYAVIDDQDKVKTTLIECNKTCSENDDCMGFNFGSSENVADFTLDKILRAKGTCILMSEYEGVDEIQLTNKEGWLFRPKRKYKVIIIIFICIVLL